LHETNGKYENLNQGFSNGALGSPWGPRSGSLGATSRGLHLVALSWYCITQVSRYIKYLPVKGVHGSRKFENHWPK